MIIVKGYVARGIGREDGWTGRWMNGVFDVSGDGDGGRRGFNPGRTREVTQDHRSQCSAQRSRFQVHHPGETFCRWKRCIPRGWIPG